MHNEENMPKVQAMYEAVTTYLEDSSDLQSLTVSEITKRAGIGKGTAYEYFSNKEELIAGALYSKLNQSCLESLTAMKTQENFSDKVFFILTAMEGHESEKTCMLKVIRVMNEDSEIGKIMEKMIQDPSTESIVPKDVISYLVDSGISEIPKKEQKQFLDYYSRDFLIYSMFGKLFSYGMYLYGKCPHEISEKKMKEMVYREILQQYQN